jgi:hypothetical protein
MNKLFFFINCIYLVSSIRIYGINNMIFAIMDEYEFKIRPPLDYFINNNYTINYHEM